MQDLVLEIQARLVKAVDRGDPDAEVALLRLKELSEQVIELEDALAVSKGAVAHG